MRSVPVVPAVSYVALNCTGRLVSSNPFKAFNVGPMLFHIVTSSLKQHGLRPAIATTSLGLATVDEMAKGVRGAVAGINGGYFWEVNRGFFIDDVCLLKTRQDALANVSLTRPNNGIGDGATIVDGQYLSSNCDCVGFNRPTSLIINGTNSSIIVQNMGDRLPPWVQNAIAAGPNLVSWDNGPVYGVPALDENVNRWEHSSNSAIGLMGSPGNFSEIVMVVSDGSDSCASSDPTCGISAEPMAYFMKDLIGAGVAMEFDQGGSSTLWVKGLGIVNNNRNSPRQVFNGLFVTL